MNNSYNNSSEDLNIDFFHNDHYYELNEFHNDEYRKIYKTDESIKHRHRIKFKLNNGYTLSCIAGDGTYSDLKSDYYFNVGANIQDYLTWEIAVFDENNNFDRSMLKFFADDVYDDVLASIKCSDINLFLEKYGIRK